MTRRRVVFVAPQSRYEPRPAPGRAVDAEERAIAALGYALLDDGRARAVCAQGSSRARAARRRRRACAEEVGKTQQGTIAKGSRGRSRPRRRVRRLVGAHADDARPRREQRRAARRALKLLAEERASCVGAQLAYSRHSRRASGETSAPSAAASAAARDRRRRRRRRAGRPAVGAGPPAGRGAISGSSRRRESRRTRARAAASSSAGSAAGRARCGSRGGTGSNVTPSRCAAPATSMTTRRLPPLG